MSSHSTPTRTLPPKPSLAQLRKQAKDLLKSYPRRHRCSRRRSRALRLEADPARCACDMSGVTPLHLAARRHNPARWAGFSTGARSSMHATLTAKHRSTLRLSPPAGRPRGTTAFSISWKRARRSGAVLRDGPPVAPKGGGTHALRRRGPRRPRGRVTAASRRPARVRD